MRTPRSPRRSRRTLPFVFALAATLITFFSLIRPAQAVPSFARKYETSCLTCHTVYPALNPFGEAFRRNGYRFPSQNGSVDSDATKAEHIPLGQEEYKKTFPNSVWPDKISKSVPLSLMLNGSVAVNLPGSDAEAAAGNTFTWAGISGEFHLFAAGSFDDKLTYFGQLTIPDDGTIEIETAYVLWNDVAGPRHLFNIWLGRLMSPQLNSFGFHSSYISDTFLPAVTVAGLYSPSASFTLGQGHSDGIEANGIIGHRVDWSVGWIASSVSPGLGLPNAEDVYAHIGVKSGGVALDGEGRYGPNAPDPEKPWAEKAITLDVFAYHGLSLFDNGTGTVANGTAAPIGQRDTFNALGGSLRAQWDSLILNSGIAFEFHSQPYPGTFATVNGVGATINGAADATSATSIVQYNELDYVVFPWFVPALRTEFTRLTQENAGAVSLFRVMPGIATLIRPNIKVVLTGDIERARGVPQAGPPAATPDTVGQPEGWSPAGGFIAPAPVTTKLEAEQIVATLAVAF